MFDNITDLMSTFDMRGFVEFRLSRKGNWGVSGRGALSYTRNYETGSVDYYWIDAVYRHDGTGTLISYRCQLFDGYDY